MKKIGKRKRQLRRKYFIRKLLLTAGLLGAAACLVVCVIYLYQKKQDLDNTISMVAAVDSSQEDLFLDMETSNSLKDIKAAMARPSSFSPSCTESTDPALYIASTGIEVNGQALNNLSDYRPADILSFDAGLSYTEVNGIVTFRGNNFRDTAAYGYTDIQEGTINELWTAKTGALTYGDATWSGSGWTGQPLMEKWPPCVLG